MSDDPATSPPPSRTAAQRIGDAAEEAVVDHLTEAGWVVVARNVHVGRAEIDLIAIDPRSPRTLVFVEVRHRATRDFGLAEETVDHRKRARIHAAAFRWLDTRPAASLVGLPVRFDLVVVEPDPTARSRRIRHHLGAL